MDRDPIARGRRNLQEWTRDPADRKIAGVCAGLARQLDVPVTLVRAGFVLVTLLPGMHATGIVAYLVLWFLMPAGPGEPTGLDRILEGVDSLRGRRDPHDLDDAWDDGFERTADRFDRAVRGETRHDA